jgi:hypothetical protein
MNIVLKKIDINRIECYATNMPASKDNAHKGDQHIFCIRLKRHSRYEYGLRRDGSLNSAVPTWLHPGVDGTKPPTLRDLEAISREATIGAHFRDRRVRAANNSGCFFEKCSGVR